MAIEQVHIENDQDFSNDRQKLVYNVQDLLGSLGICQSGAKGWPSCSSRLGKAKYVLKFDCLVGRNADTDWKQVYNLVKKITPLYWTLELAEDKKLKIHCLKFHVVLLNGCIYKK